MPRFSPWWIVGPGLLIVLAILAASATGAFGPLLPCGADGAAVCVAWPAVASFGTWLLFIGCLVGLAAWQVAEWRDNKTNE